MSQSMRRFDMRFTMPASFECCFTSSRYACGITWLKMSIFMQSSDSVHLAIEAAKLLGRWTLIAERHTTGCSCCPGLGDVTMQEVEGRVVAWLRPKHPLLETRDSVTGLLRDCIARSQPAGTEVLQPLFRDLDEALGHLEQVQHGF